MNTFPTTFKDFVEQYDKDTLKDIVEHGCISGCAGGLIYYSETKEVFDRYEDEIEEILDDINYRDKPDHQPISHVINDRVWTAVEIIASQLLDEQNENEAQS